MERPVSPYAIKRAGTKFNRPLEETQELMRDALREEATWWASKGGKPSDIEPMLRASAAECGKPSFVTESEISQIAIHAFKSYIELQRSWGARSDDIALTPPNNIRDELREVENEIDYRTEQFSFGIWELDEAIGGGIMKGQIMSIIGNPGSMKTSLLLSGIERWIAESSENAAFFSLDMSKSAIFERLMMRELRCGRRILVEKYRAGAEDYAAAKERLAKRLSGRLAVLGNRQTPRWDIDSLARYVQYNVPGLVAIDYLTLLKKPGQSDYDAANEGMLRLQDLSRQYRTAIVVLSQMSLESRREQARGGTGGAARGGGIVNEIADIELELFRDVSPKSEDGAPKIVATITKTRSGIAGSSWQLNYNGPLMTFKGTAARVKRALARKPVFDDA